MELQASTSRVDGIPRAMDEPNIDGASTQPLPASYYQPHSPARSTIFTPIIGKALRVHYSGTLDSTTGTLVYRHIKHPSTAMENEGGNNQCYLPEPTAERTGPEVTNNWCEYSTLKDGLVYSAHYLQHYEVKLEAFGDSQMMIAAQNGFASMRQTKLQPLAVQVNQIISNFACTSWNHTTREQNKMADLLANMAINSKSAKILTDEPRGNDQVVMSKSQLYSAMISVPHRQNSETPHSQPC
ncbi:reverse transcriptase, partial [Globisporangium splendens]